jgi:poly-gamma-glutamate synthesis protein (capsule biosynthesis protein)
MKFLFTGDLCFINIEKYIDNPFKNIAHVFKEYNSVINLEAVFMPDDTKREQIKNKVCLKQKASTIELFKIINPYLVNLSNNHINDYGNHGVDYTKKILDRIKCFGVGYDYENHNVFTLKKEKVVFISYTTRNTDLSGSKLFNTDSFLGPKEYSLELFNKQSFEYKNYQIIVLFHWGIENIHYPLLVQRKIGRELIENGVDLIIGNHAHVIQGYEKYKGKWIFYSLGNFLLPEFKYSYKGVQYKVKQEKHNKKSIIPMFSIKDKIVLDKIVTIEADSHYNLYIANNKQKYNIFLLRNFSTYRILYFIMKIKKIFSDYSILLKRKIIKFINY